jgi:hypothetical protein
MPYHYFERVRLLVESHCGSVLEQDFGAQVALTARFRIEHLPDFQETLRKLSHGSLRAEILTTEETIMPLKSQVEA